MRIGLKYLLAIVCLGIVCPAFANVHVTGKVTCAGRGVADVVVTDGTASVATDASGCYALNAVDDAHFIYISTPAGYLPPADGVYPRFYIPFSKDKAVYDFTVTRNPKDDNHQLVIVQADVQAAYKKDLETYKSLVADCRDLVSRNYSDRDAFSLDLGDLVEVGSGLMPIYDRNVQPIAMPVYHAVGNHDMDFWGRSHETSYSTFEAAFGPQHYSFNRGKIHYIVIDNCFYIGRGIFYIGYVDEATFRWLDSDLAFVPAGSTVILSMHIPSQLTEKERDFVYEGGPISDETVNAAHLHELLKPYKAHIFTGHMHYNLNICFSDSLMEHNTAAVCGTWWTTDVCLDGTPRGYGVYEIDGDNIKWYYKSSGYPRSHQMRLYNVGESKDFPDCVVANVWNYDKRWRVEWLENGKVMGEMTKFTGYDPYASALCADRSIVKYDWISPFTTEHLFRAVPANPKAKIEVRVTDRFGNVYQDVVPAVKAKK
jgi:hypothetical protein